MPLFSSSSPFDPDVEKATSENNTTEDWGLIMEICDKVQSNTNGCKDCLKSIVKRLNHSVPNVAMQSLTLLDACINNCGRAFLLEICSRDFETEIKKQLIGKAHPKVADKLKELLKKWAEGEFKNDQQLNLIPSLYNKLKSDGISFASQDPPKKSSPAISKDPNVVSSQQEEDDIAQAIELSLKDSGGISSKVSSTPAVNSQIYPTVKAPSPTPLSQPVKEPRKVRAIYDFEAAEDNELTFKSGEIIHVLDDSDVNWWKGSNQRGEGLFPSNFVTADLSLEPEVLTKPEKKSVQFSEDVQVKTVEREEPIVTEISETKIDELLHMLHEADPTGERPDLPDLISLEEQCAAMNPLIDQQLESVDRKHASLTLLSRQLVDALNMYHSLMREYPVQQPPPNASYPVPNYPAPPQKIIPSPQYGYQVHQPELNHPGHPIHNQMYNGPQPQQPYMQHQGMPPQFQQQQQPSQVGPYQQFQPEMNHQINSMPGMMPPNLPNPHMGSPIHNQANVPRMPMQMADPAQVPANTQYSSIPFSGPAYSHAQGMNNYSAPVQGTHVPEGSSYAPQQLAGVGGGMPPVSVYQQPPMMTGNVSNGSMPHQETVHQQPLL